MKKKTIGIVFPQQIAEEMEKRAEKLGVSVSRYLLQIVLDFVESGEKLEIREP